MACTSGSGDHVLARSSKSTSLQQRVTLIPPTSMTEVWKASRMSDLSEPSCSGQPRYLAKVSTTVRVSTVVKTIPFKFQTPWCHQLLQIIYLLFLDECITKKAFFLSVMVVCIVNMWALAAFIVPHHFINSGYIAYSNNSESGNSNNGNIYHETFKTTVIKLSRYVVIQL